MATSRPTPRGSGSENTSQPGPGKRSPIQAKATAFPPLARSPLNRSHHNCNHQYTLSYLPVGSPRIEHFLVIEQRSRAVLQYIIAEVRNEL